MTLIMVNTVKNLFMFSRGKNSFVTIDGSKVKVVSLVFRLARRERENYLLTLELKLNKYKHLNDSYTIINTRVRL